MSDELTSDCGCCASPERLPAIRYNPPALPEIQYRIGNHGEFKAALLARLSSSEYPALEDLRTRDDDDFTIALCDAHALMLHVLSFYNERIANESYLRTATERRSILELSRLIGYQLAPGVAASTHLAFLLEDAPGMRSLAAGPVTIPVGTRVQSVPGPNEQPQTFETVEPVTARVEWNAIPVQTSERQTLGAGTRELIVASTSVQLQPGDVILIVGDERAVDDITSENWDARVIETVEIDNNRSLTRVTWTETEPLEHLSKRNPRAYVFRQLAALFGHNAPDPRLLFKDGPGPTGLTEGEGAALTWADYAIQGNRIDLDSSYPRILAGSWVVLAGGIDGEGPASLPGSAQLYRAESVRQWSRSNFALTGRVTRIRPDLDVASDQFPLPRTLVLAQSEELPLAETLLKYPLYGAEVALGRRSERLKPKQAIALGGKRARLQILVEDPALEFMPDGGAAVPTKPRDSFTVVAPPVFPFFGAEIALTPQDLGALLSNASTLLRWRLADRDGRTGTLDATIGAVRLQRALDGDPLVSELCIVADVENAVQHDRDRTTLLLDTPLNNVYDRATAAVCANLAPATHGENVGEIAGSGSAAEANQRFVLKQAPLTYVSASTPNGRLSTLEMRVDGLLWEEVPSLFGHGPNEHVYSLRQDDEQRSIVQTGDGIEGARLLTGRDNVRFRYRRYLGDGGNVPPGRITTLLAQPLGVKAVTNPVEASGGQDAESRDDARRNAPLTVLTLGRAVSIQDYTDFARGFAGIAKALAIWIGAGASRGVFLTIAGPDGDPIESGAATYSNLIEALRRYGDPLLPLQVRSYQPVTFRLEARIKIFADALAELVIPAVESRLRTQFAFAARDFAQPVTLDEVMAVMHGVAGVDAVDVDALYRVEPGAQATPNARLFAHYPHALDDGSLVPAELLTLDPGPLALAVMP